MQTFLPYESFSSVAQLDRRRLNNQLNEAGVIYQAIKGAKAWANHPAVLMWKNYPMWLCMYAVEVAKSLQRTQTMATWLARSVKEPHAPLPRWLGCADFHRAHRANLKRKDPEHYAIYDEVEGSDIYVWPLELSVPNTWELRTKKVGAPKYGPSLGILKE